jgi:SAM-dependent methyltransferase
MTTLDADYEPYLELLAAKPGERILNIGPADGQLDGCLAPRVAPEGCIVTAADFTLPFAESTFDAALCIGELAFCHQPRQALSTIRRALRGGGRLVVACADEDTRIYNARDRVRGRRIARAMADRAVEPWIGRRLAHTLALAGFRLARELVKSEVERHFQPGLSGYSLANRLRAELVTSGHLEAEDYDGWLEDLRAAEWDGSYCYSVTIFAYLAERE